MARGRDAEAWVPVSQLLAGVPIAASAPAFPTSQGAAHAAAPALDLADNPVPPNCHWIIVLVLGMATASVFTAVWAVVQATWVRRINPQSNALRFLLLALGAGVLGPVINESMPEFAGISVLFSLAAFVLFLFAEAAMRSDLESYYNSTENIHLQLSGAMIFFFNVLYFQYHLSRIARWKKTGVLKP
jgi:hypothetical protein